MDESELAGRLAVREQLLIVEDDTQFVEEMDRELGRYFDFRKTILKAYDGNTGYDLAMEYRPGLVILGLMIPQMSGTLVLKKIKRGRKEIRPYTIIATGCIGRSHQTLAESLGANAYIQKPFEMQALAGEVRRGLDALYKFPGGFGCWGFMDEDTRKKLIGLRGYLDREAMDLREAAQKLESTKLTAVRARAKGREEAFEEARNRLSELFPGL